MFTFKKIKVKLHKYSNDEVDAYLVFEAQTESLAVILSDDKDKYSYFIIVEKNNISNSYYESNVNFVNFNDDGVFSAMAKMLDDRDVAEKSKLEFKQLLIKKLFGA